MAKMANDKQILQELWRCDVIREFGNVTLKSNEKLKSSKNTTSSFFSFTPTNGTFFKYVKKRNFIKKY